MAHLSDQDTPVLAAVRCNQRAVVKELLAMGVDVNTANAGGDTALTLAVATGNTELVQDLLAAGCNPAKRIGYVSLASHFLLGPSAQYSYGFRDGSSLRLPVLRVCFTDMHLLTLRFVFVPGVQRSWPCRSTKRSNSRTSR